MNSGCVSAFWHFHTIIIYLFCLTEVIDIKNYLKNISLTLSDYICIDVYLFLKLFVNDIKFSRILKKIHYLYNILNTISMNRESSIESDANLSAILEHGLFSSEEELMHEIQDFEKMKFATGTKIVIFNVRKYVLFRYNLIFCKYLT